MDSFEHPERLQTACFTGHRPQRLPWRFDESDPRCVKLLEQLRNAVEQAANDGYRYFFSGGAVGVDLWAAEQVLELKTEYPGLRLHMAIPCGGQESGWPYRQRQRYYGILSQADDMVVLQPHYVQGCMAARNRYMVERSSRLIAVYDGGTGGGTGQTVAMARKQGLEVVMIKP